MRIGKKFPTRESSAPFSLDFRPPFAKLKLAAKAGYNRQNKKK